MTRLRATRCAIAGGGNAHYIEPQLPRSVKSAVLDAITLREAIYTQQCDCGQPTSHMAAFYQLNTTRQQRIPAALAVCHACAVQIDDAIKIYTLQEAYYVAGIEIPKWLYKRLTQHVAASESIR